MIESLFNVILWYSLESYTSNSTTQHETTTRAQHDRTWDNASTTRDNASTTRHNTRQHECNRDSRNTTREKTSATRGSTSAKQPKIYFDFFISSLHTWSLVSDYVAKLRKLKIAFSWNSQIELENIKAAVCCYCVSMSLFITIILIAFSSDLKLIRVNVNCFRIFSHVSYFREKSFNVVINYLEEES